MGLSTADVENILSKLGSKQSGVFRRDQAISRGLSSHQLETRLKSGRLKAIFPSVYRNSAVPESTPVLLSAIKLYSGKDLVFSHGTAAWLYGLNGFREPRRLEVSGLAYLSRRWLTIHEAPVELEDRYVVRNEFVCTTMERMLVDLAAQLTEKRLEEAVDDALRQSLTTRSKLRAAVERLCGRGRDGSATLRRLVRARELWGRELPESDFEVALLHFFKEQRFPAPQLQQPLFDAAGRWVGRVDFCFPEQRLIVEADGAYFHATRKQRRRDDYRDQVAALQGWETVRVTWKELETPSKLAQQARPALRGVRPEARPGRLAWCGQRPIGSGGLTMEKAGNPRCRAARVR